MGTTILQVSALVSGIAAIVGSSVYLGRRIMSLIRSVDRIWDLPNRYDSIEKVLKSNSDSILNLTHTVEMLSKMVSPGASP